MKSEITKEYVWKAIQDIIDDTGHGRVVVYISGRKITIVEPRPIMKALDCTKAEPGYRGYKNSQPSVAIPTADSCRFADGESSAFSEYPSKPSLPST